MKLRQGNVFTGVCQSFCSMGEGTGGYLADTPMQTTPGRHPPADTPQQTSLGRHPRGQTHPRPNTPRRHPLGRDPLRPSTCWDTLTPLPRRSLQRTVRILLECILGSKICTHSAIYYRPQVKVMFSEASVCLWEVCFRKVGLLSGGKSSSSGGLPKPTALKWSSVDHCSGRDASYWNTFLFK